MSELEAVLDHYLAEWDSAGWAHAFHSIIELGPAVLPELERRLAESGDPRFRSELVLIAHHLHTESALPLLEAALFDRAERVWKAALDGLVGLGSSAAIHILERSLSDPVHANESPDWRSWVQEALDQARGDYP
jgi:HEAT repeat protein